MLHQRADDRLFVLGGVAERPYRRRGFFIGPKTCFRHPMHGVKTLDGLLDLPFSGALGRHGLFSSPHRRHSPLLIAE